MYRGTVMPVQNAVTIHMSRSFTLFAAQIQPMKENAPTPRPTTQIHREFFFRQLAGRESTMTSSLSTAKIILLNRGGALRGDGFVEF